MSKMYFRVGLLSALLGVAAMDAAATSVTVDQGTTLFGSEIQSITIDPQSGDIVITTTTGNWSLGQTGNTPPPPPSPSEVTVDLKVNNQGSVSVTEGTSVTLSWSVSNATSCQTLNNGTAWDNQSINLTGGSAAITVNFTGTKTFRLDCSNSGGSAADTVSVTGIAKTPGPTPGTGSCPQVGTVDIVDWTDFSYRGADFPQSGGTQQIYMRPGITKAIKFTVPAGTAAFSQISTAPASGYVALDGQYYHQSLSACPGDFDPPNPTYCYRNGSGPQWWEIAGRGLYGMCSLEVGKTYYFNMQWPNGCNNSNQCAVRMTSR